MRQTWRWFGPHDLTSVDDMRQAGVEGVVSALHHVATGAVWTTEDIAKRQRAIGRKDGPPSGLAWEVVESLPVSEDIKKQKGDWRGHIANYKQSLPTSPKAGPRTICYNFMPVLDWTRTDLAYRVGHGGTCMRFDLTTSPPSTSTSSSAPALPKTFPRRCARRRPSGSRRWTRGAQELARNVVFGLPGSTEGHVVADVRDHLAEYGRDLAERLRQQLRRLPRRGGADGRGGRHPAVLPPGRSALRAARPAADHVDGRGLRGDPRRGRQPGERHDALHRLARGAPRQRSAGDDAAIRRQGAFPPPAQRPPRGRGRRHLVPRGGASGRQHRHGRA